jgi:tetratricopeptide (TPR) repeat protein
MAWLGLAQEYRAVGPDAAEQRLEAITRAAALMGRAPGLGRVYAERAEALLQLGRLDEASAEARKALQVQQNLLLPRSVLASVAEHRGAWTEARDQLRTILGSLEPGDARGPGIRQRLEEAERRLREADAR